MALTLKEKGALLAIFAKTLDNPDTFQDFLNNPDSALIDLGLSDDEIDNVMDFLVQFRDNLEAVLQAAPVDHWPPQ